MTDLSITVGSSASNDDKAKKVVELMKKGLTKEQAMKKLATADMKAMLMDSVGAKSDEPLVNEGELPEGEMPEGEGEGEMSTDEETPMDAMDTDEGNEGETSEDMPAEGEDPEMAKKKKLIKEMVAMGLR